MKTEANAVNGMQSGGKPETAHTPGPWDTRDDDKRITVGCGLVEGPNGYDVAEVYNDDCDRAEAWANARLIAAAPDLLDAVNGAIHAIESGNLNERMCCNGHECGCYGSTHAEFVLHHLRAAIAKATTRLTSPHARG